MTPMTERFVRRMQRLALRAALREIAILALLSYVVLWFAHPLLGFIMFVWCMGYIAVTYFERVDYARSHIERRLWTLHTS